MKTFVKISLGLFLLLVGMFVFISMYAINNPDPKNCEIKEIVVSKIYEGGVKDIVFDHENGGVYYINRGLENGLTLEGMEEKVLNKKVTLHLAKNFSGTTRHIAQLQLGEEVIYTEFD